MKTPTLWLVTAIAAVLVLPACGSQPPGPVTPPPASAPTSSSPPVPPPDMFAPVSVIELPEPGMPGPGWVTALTLPYGAEPAGLGTSPGGEGLDWGPDYGTQAPDGTWWILDSARKRLAHFDDEGAYLDQVLLSADVLANGEYVQYQPPKALADGSLVLGSTSIGNGGLLVAAPDGALRRVSSDRFVGVVGTDGERVYGFDSDGATVAVDPANGAVGTVDGFTGQGGRPFDLVVGDGSLTVRRGANQATVAVRAAGEPDAAAHPSVEAVMGSDGVLSVLVTAITEETVGQPRQYAGFLRFDEQARATPVEPVPSLWSEADPGSPAHLGIRLGDDRPWLMVVDTDAVRVYRRG